MDRVDASFRTIATAEARWLEGFSTGSVAVALWCAALPERFGAVSMIGPAPMDLGWSGIERSAARLKGTLFRSYTDNPTRAFAKRTYRFMSELGLKVEVSHRGEEHSAIKHYQVQPDPFRFWRLCYDRVEKLTAGRKFEPPGSSPPTADVRLTRKAEGRTVSFSVERSSDSYGGRLVSVLVDFGDGRTTQLPITRISSPVSHSYASGGTYTVGVTVTDDDGLTDSASLKVTLR